MPESSLHEALLQSSTGNPTDSFSAGPLRAGRLVRTLHGRNRSKAEIRVYETDDGAIALKDYGRRPAWFRQTAGRFLVRREVAAYRAAAGVPGLGRFLGRVGSCALALEWIDARPLAEIPPGEVPAETISRLSEIVAALHARGVALADLHHRDVLVGKDERVHVIDLAAAWTLGGGGPLRRWLFDLFCAQDLVSVERMRARLDGEDPDEAVAAMGGRGAVWHRRGRRIKSSWNRLRGRGDRTPNGERS